MNACPEALSRLPAMLATDKIAIRFGLKNRDLAGKESSQ